MLKYNIRITSQKSYESLLYVYAYALHTVLGGIALVLGYLQLCFWQLASTRQTRRIRMNLFRCILHQDIGWFDTQSPGTMNTRLSE